MQPAIEKGNNEENEKMSQGKGKRVHFYIRQRGIAQSPECLLRV